jgi:hypothetical protein
MSLSGDIMSCDPSTAKTTSTVKESPMSTEPAAAIDTVGAAASQRLPGLNQPAPHFGANTPHGRRTLTDYKGK